MPKKTLLKSYIKNPSGQALPMPNAQIRHSYGSPALLKQLIIGAALALFLLQACSSGTLFRTRLEFSSAEIEQRLQQKFPFKKKHAFFTVTFSDPKVRLEQGAERMALRCAVDAVLLGSQSYKGELELDGIIAYQKEKGEFYLADSTVRRFTLQGVSIKYQKQLEAVAGEMLEVALATHPIYTLKQGSFKHSLAKLVLKEVLIEDGKVVAIVGL